MKRYYLLMMLAIWILMAGCEGGYSAIGNVTETDTLGVGILGNSLKNGIDTLVIVAKEKKENVLLPDVEQVAEGKVPLQKIINGATHSRRMVLVVALIIICLLTVRLFIAFNRKEQGRMCLRLFALITLVSGWALYYVGFFFGGTASSVLAYCVRPLIASLGMFVGNTGFQELSGDCTRSVLFMTIFAIVHLAAILVSTIFVINFFWKRSKSYLRGKYWLFTRSSAPLNVFFGLGKQNILLAQSIQKEKKGQERILFIDLPTEDDGQREEFGLSQLFGFNAYSQEAIRELQGVDYAIKGAMGKPSEAEATDGDILGKLGLHPVRKLINHHEHTRIFFLSDNEVENVKSTISLMQDATLKKNKVDIYCHARKNRENGVIEKMAYLEGEKGQLNVHVVDTSALAIQTLMRHVEYQPVSFVEPNTETATVDKPFTALALGFGETGRDAVRFLYEFGAFVDSKGEKSPFKCYAVDKKMYQLKGDFYNNAPALRTNPEIELLQLSNQSSRFWPWVEEILPQLNYIVVALGDDRSNMQAVADLFETACRVRFDNMKNFKIFVRSYSRENEKQLDSLVKFYNDKCGAMDNKNKISDILVVFGKSSDLFTYENIIDDETIAKAIVFYERYAEMARQKDNWDERHRIRIESTDENGKKIREDMPREQVTLNDINAVIRKEAQDIANSKHMDTKLKLVGLTRASAKDLFRQKDGSNLTEEQLRQKNLLEYIQELAASEDENKYIKDEERIKESVKDQAIRNIAICEHLRWIASHEMIGYELGDKTDEMRKQHDCLMPWQDLPSKTQDYDYNVMEQTVKIVINEKTEKDEDK